MDRLIWNIQPKFDYICLIFSYPCVRVMVIKRLLMGICLVCVRRADTVTCWLETVLVVCVNSGRSRRTAADTGTCYLKPTKPSGYLIIWKSTQSLVYVIKVTRYYFQLQYGSSFFF